MEFVHSIPMAPSERDASSGAFAPGRKKAGCFFCLFGELLLRLLLGDRNLVLGFPNC